MYKYTHFIPENIAPVGTTKIIVRNSANQEICNFPLGNLTPPTGDKLYSFMAISDAHIGKGDDNNEQADLANALEYANKNCDFTCICGDLTEDGIKDQLDEYKDIVDNHTPDRPVYAIAGNHENYSNRVNSLGENYLVNYTGQPLYYSFTKGDDVFIMVGHYGGYAGDGIGWLSTEFVSTKELQWLYETLEANRNKRCFIFNHVFPSEHKVGNPKTFYKRQRMRAYPESLACHVSERSGKRHITSRGRRPQRPTWHNARYRPCSAPKTAKQLQRHTKAVLRPGAYDTPYILQFHM